MSPATIRNNKRAWSSFTSASLGDIDNTGSSDDLNERSWSSLPTDWDKKSVRFADYDEVAETHNIQDLKKATNIKNLWFTKRETEYIRSRCRELVERMEYGFPCNTKQDCSRGLERYTPTQARDRQRRIVESVLAVLEEQDLQREEGINDPDLLADVYFSRTYKSVRAAYRIGLRDSKNALH